MYKEIIELLEQEKGLARDMLLLLENGQMEAKNLTSQIVNMGKMIAIDRKSTRLNSSHIH